MEVEMSNGTNRDSTILDGGAAASFRDALVGAWGLVSCVETDVATGEIFLPMGERPQGFILYTPDGYMSAQLSAPVRANFVSGDMYQGAPDEYLAAGISYLAYSGPYYVDEARGIVEHEMAVSLFPNWKGERQVRIAELEGDQLVLATDRPSLFAGSLKTARITWRRASPNR
jgi:Lipocalin-like domain